MASQDDRSELAVINDNWYYLYINSIQVQRRDCYRVMISIIVINLIYIAQLDTNGILTAQSVVIVHTDAVCAITCGSPTLPPLTVPLPSLTALTVSAWCCRPCILQVHLTTEGERGGREGGRWY